VSLFKRFKLIAQAKANKMADRAENPTETIELGYEKMKEQSRAVKSGIAEIATAKAHHARQLKDLDSQITKLTSQAQQAAIQGQDEVALMALERKTALETQRIAVQDALEEVAAKQQALEQSAKRFDQKLHAFAISKETTKARYEAANAQVRINEVLSGVGEEAADIGLALQRAQDKTAALEARGSGLDELLANGVLDDLTAQPGDDIQAALEAGRPSAAAELEAMKLELGVGTPKAITSGESK